MRQEAWGVLIWFPEMMKADANALTGFLKDNALPDAAPNKPMMAIQ